jgi:simple sugar transport system ATP-binding protein
MKVELRHIHKHFGPVHANNDITLSIPAGTIQGLLGENGAGKSTLMKILSGFLRADSGEILLDDRRVIIRSPADAIRHGIGMLHQDPLDFPPLRVIDNFLLGQQAKGIFLQRNQALEAFQRLAQQYDFSLDPFAYVENLTVGERQQLEILRLLWLGVRVLILDEPTTGISAAQKQKLFATLRRLAEEGRTVIFVSHKLEEVEELCHRVAVLRAGRLVGEMYPPYDTRKLVEMMFGREIQAAPRASFAASTPVLRLQQMTLEDVRLRMTAVDLDVHAGETIGLAGMEGSGQDLFLRACAGLVRPVAGRVLVGEQDLTGKAYHAYKRAGVEFLPAARLEEGLVPGLTLSEHFLLVSERQGFFLQRAYAQRLAEEQIALYNIKGRPHSPVESLSGGNQQRALLALLRQPLSLLLLEHPTRGLDVESSIYIWSLLKERCRQGTAILFISSDLEEILQYSDRVLVFFSGKVSSPLEASALSVEELGGLIGGKGWEKFGVQRES